MRPTISHGSRGIDVADWQGLIGSTIDGVFGPGTVRITKEWQKAHDLTADGVVGPETWRMAEPEREFADMSSVVHVKGIENLTVSDLRALKATADWIGIDVDHLAAAISFETGGSFSPAKKNAAGSGATGLIQFMPTTARNLGTTTEQLAKMTFVQQLEYVKAYFAPWRGKLHTLEDVYLAIFYPKEVGKQPQDIIATNGDPNTQRVYEQNAGFDTTGKGFITRADVTTTIIGVLNRAIAAGPRVTIPMSTAGALAAGVGAYGLYKLYNMRART